MDLSSLLAFKKDTNQYQYAVPIAFAQEIDVIAAHHAPTIAKYSQCTSEDYGKVCFRADRCLLDVVRPCYGQESCLIPFRTHL